ncbi:hypothetical protein CY0110_16832 [Crocosphaera chwakensis CCY0110]|uniref:Uncharacterized protein n=1 Tax=Crocosphaera chwakensis CCY0110 TaxID=391612 RepID=A3II48_9CHRO|nr:hypothetical protein CY0110_16832 [Crocosphaera chwakensis CCY0110]
MTEQEPSSYNQKNIIVAPLPYRIWECLGWIALMPFYLPDKDRF